MASLGHLWLRVVLPPTPPLLQQRWLLCCPLDPKSASRMVSMEVPSSGIGLCRQAWGHCSPSAES